MKAAALLLLILAALAPAAGRALSSRGCDAVSRTKAFSVDGRRFLVEEPTVDEASVARRELAKRGIDTLPISTAIASALPAQVAEALREQPAEKDSPPLPAGLEPDHVLRLETETGPVEIAFGRVAGDGGHPLRRLRSAGWESNETDAHGASAAIAGITKGKEASIVLVEKSEGRFLAVRRTVR